MRLFADTGSVINALCDGHTVHLSFGAKTGYRDPSF